MGNLTIFVIVLVFNLLHRRKWYMIVPSFVDCSDLYGVTGQRFETVTILRYTIPMKTIQLTIDEPLLQDVDQVVTQLQTTRSAFVRDVLQIALRRLRIRAMERQQIDAYTSQPQTVQELADWLETQDWGDDWNEPDWEHA